MHLPESPLISRAQNRFRRYARKVAVLVGIEFYYEFYLSLEFFFDPLDSRTGRDAMRSLIVDKLDNRDQRVFRAYNGRILKRYGKTFYLRRDRTETQDQ